MFLSSLVIISELLDSTLPLYNVEQWLPSVEISYILSYAEDINIKKVSEHLCYESLPAFTIKAKAP